MLPQEGTRVKILTDLRDSDDVKIVAKKNEIAQVTCHFDDHVLLRTLSGSVEFVAFEDEYEVLS